MQIQAKQQYTITNTLFAILLLPISFYSFAKSEASRVSLLHQNCHEMVLSESNPQLSCHTRYSSHRQHFEEASSFTSDGSVHYTCTEHYDDGSKVLAPYQACQEAATKNSKSISVVYFQGYQPLPFNSLEGYQSKMTALAMLYCLGNALELAVHLKELEEKARSFKQKDRTRTYVMFAILDTAWLVYEIGKHTMHAMNVRMDIAPSSISAALEIGSSIYEIPRSTYKMVTSAGRAITSVSTEQISNLASQGIEALTYMTIWINCYVTTVSAMYHDLYIVQSLNSYVAEPLKDLFIGQPNPPAYSFTDFYNDTCQNNYINSSHHPIHARENALDCLYRFLGLKANVLVEPLQKTVR